MYAKSNGILTTNKESILIDLININMNLDINDVPLAKYGIVQNFSKDNLEDSLLVLRLMILDFLDEYMMDMLKLSDVKYLNNKFIAVFEYNNKQLNVEFSS